MAQTRTAAKGAGTPQAVRLPQELIDRIDRYAARLEGELHLSVSRSDALRRLLTLALEDAEDTAEAEANAVHDEQGIGGGSRTRGVRGRGVAHELQRFRRR